MQRINLKNKKSYTLEKSLYESDTMGTSVYLVVDSDLNRRVILKKLNYKNEEEKKLVLQEIKTQTVLENYSDFVPKIYNYFDVPDDHCIYIEMQNIEGKSLRNILDEMKMMPKDKEWYDKNYNMLRKICMSMSYIHSCRGFVHKDIKPENIIVNNRRDAVYIIDFGISGPEIMNKGVGTEKYMAPEQRRRVNDHFVTQATDVFSLAQIAIEMFMGEPLLYEEDLIPAHIANKWEKFRDITDIGGTFYPQLGKILEKALALNPVERYKDARAFYGALNIRKRSDNARYKSERSYKQNINNK